MNLDHLPALDKHAAKFDHGFVFNAHNHNNRQLITRYRGTVIERTGHSGAREAHGDPGLPGFAVTGWQKSIYHFGGLNREVPILITLLLDENWTIRSLEIDGQSRGSQGKRCDFACLEALCGEKLHGLALDALGTEISTAADVKCLHLFEILSACTSFAGYLKAQGLESGAEQEYTAIFPDRWGLTAQSAHEILGKRDSTLILLNHRSLPVLNEQNLTDSLDAHVNVQYNGVEVLSSDLAASDFETVYAQLNRLFSRCQHLEKAYFGLSGRVKFSNTPSMVGLFLLTLSHSSVKGGITRAWKIEKILHYLQTGYGKNPCKGFGG